MKPATMTALEVRKCAEDMSAQLKALEPGSKDQNKIRAAAADLWWLYAKIGFYTYTPKEIAKSVNDILEKHKVN